MKKKGAKQKMTRTTYRPRSVVVSTRLTNQEARSLAAIAKNKKQKRSGFVRTALLRYIK